MSGEVITSIDQVSATWLTSVLAQSGGITQGAVQSFEFATGQGNWSRSGALRLSYTDDARGPRPQRLFLKMVDTDAGDGEYFGDSEVTYYTRDYLTLKDAPLLHCYSAAYSTELNRYHILVDDVSETHIDAAKKEPTLAYGLALAEGMAALHAHWWGEERLAAAEAPIHDSHHIQTFVDIAEPGVAHILERFSPALKPHWPAALREIYKHHPHIMVERTKNLNGFTLIHGDPGAPNILVPRDADRPIYLIDRQPFNWSLTTWLGVYDLAYAIVLDWDTELRQQWELPILERYHRHLVQNGVTDYPWRQLYDDYRLCVTMGVYIATEYCRGGVNERWVPVWLPMLQRALTAVDDLDCSALWQEK